MIARTLIAAVAATRLIRAWKYETVGEAPREALLRYLSSPVITNGQLNVPATKRREYLHELFDCPHCLGFWVTVACVLIYRKLPLARPMLEALAGAMLLSWFVQWYPGFDFSEPDPPEIIVREETADESGNA